MEMIHWVAIIIILIISFILIALYLTGFIGGGLEQASSLFKVPV